MAIKVSPRTILKEGIGWALGSCAGFVAKQIIANNVDEPEGRLDEAKLYLGQFAVTMVVKDAVQESVNRRVDAVALGIQDGLKASKEARASRQ